MQLFSVACTTCKASLQVHDEAIIGQIHACPKCGSMVLIERPREPSQEPAAAPASSLAEPVGALIAAVDPTAAAEATFADAARIVDDQPTPASTAAEPAESPSESEPAVAAAVAPLLPDAQWDPTATQPWRPLAMYGGAAIGGVVLAIGFCGLIVTLVSKPEVPPPTPIVNVEDTDANNASHLPDEPIPQPEPTATPPNEADLPPIEPVPPLPVDPPVEPATDPVVEKPIPQPVDPAPVRELEPPAVEPEPRIDVTPPTQPPARPRPEPRQIDVSARLADTFPAIAFQRMSVTDFLQFVSDLSTVPITIDPDVLTQVRANPNSAISRIDQNELSVGELLKVALAQLRLTYIVDDGHVVIVKPPKVVGQLRELRYPMSDLTRGDAGELQALIAVIQKMVAPTTWQATGGDATIATADVDVIVSQSESAHFKLLVFCEKLRVARGLSPKSKYPPALFRLDTRVGRAKAKLAAPLTMTFLQPTRLTTILARLKEVTGVTFIVDWKSAGEIGWPPDSTATLTANGITLRQSLDRLLMPMELIYRAVDETTIQITTPAALIARPDVEFYPAAELLKVDPRGERLIERIKSGLGADSFSDAGGNGELHVDIESRTLIVRLPQNHQRTLALLLRDWQPD